MDSLLLAPAPPTHSATTDKSLASTSNEYGAHDSLRYGLRSIASELVESHPLEHRLSEWDNTQFKLKLNLHRKIHGLHSPFRSIMERHLIGQTHRHPMFKSSNIAMDILDGKDEFIEIEDFLNDQDLSTEILDTHVPMENLHC